jgi:hypothetical protein
VKAATQASLRFPRRDQILDELYIRLLGAIDASLPARHSSTDHDAREIAPHPRLRLVLESDPVMASILPRIGCRFSLGPVDGPPFRLQADRLIQLSPALLDDPPSMAVAGRWGLEAARLLDGSAVSRQDLEALLRYGKRLLAMLRPESRELFLSLLPGALIDELNDGQARDDSPELLAWQSSLLGNPRVVHSEARPQPLAEVTAPLEDILVAGGDSRLSLKMDGLNRYGVPPRPRPEAIHFSSSTASAVSDYGFMYGELLRGQLLALAREGHAAEELLSRTVNATSREICRMLDLDEAEADVVIAASGTDTELIAVMLAMAGAEGRRLTNLLVAPEESGRGVALAGAGCYFDEIGATGLRCHKGAPAWPGASIVQEVIGIRDRDARPRTLGHIDGQFLELARRALAEGGHVLAHVLWASKTGIVAPSRAAVERLTGMAPDRVDIVIDACQMRMNFGELGAYLRRGWMLQISGSKFLTGPPFSGALILPLSMRARLQGVSAAMAAAPAVTNVDSWARWWSKRLPRAPGAASFGPLFRWLPALLEASLFKHLPQAFCDFAFDRFREALARRVARSEFLHPISSGELFHDEELMARRSIVSFQVLGRLASGELAALGERECRWLFEQLNLDADPLLPGLAEKERTLARQQAHVGQPVTLHTGSGPITLLRMVIGARFFSIVGYAGPDAVTAALESEIADAERAVSKIELLAANWWRIAPAYGMGR